MNHGCIMWPVKKNFATRPHGEYVIRAFAGMNTSAA